MTCRRFKKDMIMDLYGELGEARHRRLEGHLARCPSCREEFEATRKIHATLGATPADAVPEVDWERNWKAIASGLEPAPRRARLFFPRWAWAPLALAVLFVLGIAVGRYWWPSRPAAPPSGQAEVLSPAAERVVLSRFFEDVTPVLLDYAHDGTRPGTEAARLSDRDMARSLLIQNLLLKRALARRNPTLADLFDDLGMILTEIANLRNQDTSTPVLLKNVINERQVLNRIRRLEKI